MSLSTNQHIADPVLVEKLNQRLEEFRKLRVGYTQLNEGSSSENEGAIEKKKVKETRKRSIIERFFFSEYQ